MESNKHSIIKTIIRIIVLIIGFEIIMQLIAPYGGKILWQALSIGKYGRVFVAELLVLLIVVLIIFIIKKKYIFSNSKVSVGKTLVLGGPIAIISLLELIANLKVIKEPSFSVVNLISVILMALAIGFMEELFYRGIIQNELVERLSKNKKQLILALVISSLIFGLSHITNLFAGQTLFQTLIQVFQTATIGLIFAAVYYRTKNIWGIGLLHGIYDLTIMLGEINYLKDCSYTSNLSTTNMIIMIISSLILSLIYIFYTWILLLPSKIEPLLNNNELTIEEKRKESRFRETLIIIIIILVGLQYAFGIFRTFLKVEDMYVCYEYKETIIDGYETHYYNYNTYKVTDDLSIYLDTNNVYIEYLGNKEQLSVNNIYKLIVYKDNNIYNMVLLGFDGVDYKVYHSTFDIDNINYYDILKLNSYIVPNCTNIGVLNDGENNYPMINTTTNKIMILKDKEFVIVSSQ